MELSDEQWRVMAEVAKEGEHDYARLLEAEIERRGLQEQYIDALTQELWTKDRPYGAGPLYEHSMEYQWFLLRATPEARARAFLKAVGYDA